MNEVKNIDTQCETRFSSTTQETIRKKDYKMSTFPHTEDTSRKKRCSKATTTARQSTRRKTGRKGTRK